MDPMYTTQVLAWSLIWSASGIAIRQWLAIKDAQFRAAARDRQQAGR